VKCQSAGLLRRRFLEAALEFRRAQNLKKDFSSVGVGPVRPCGTPLWVRPKTGHLSTTPHLDLKHKKIVSGQERNTKLSVK
jgi:hypothetical protein